MTLTLHYFDAPGRAESIRLAFYLGGIEFTNAIVPFEQWLDNLKKKAPNNRLPYLEFPDKSILSESSAILLYAAKLANLVPTDPLDCAHAEEVMSLIRDIDPFLATFRQSNVPSEREAAAEGVKAPLQRIDAALKRRNSATGFITGDKLCYADLAVLTRLFMSLHSMAPELKEGFAKDYPHIAKCAYAVCNHPKVMEYYKEQGKSDSGGVVDMDLYSRQIGTIGYEAMCRLTTLRALISGMNGTGVEVAKNLILGGPKHVTIHDDSEVCINDLGSNCYLTEKDLRRSRASVCVDKLQDLNSYVTVSQHVGTITPSVVSAHEIVVAVDYDRIALEQLSLLCREQGVKFIAVNSFGLCASVFVDFGSQFLVRDVDGEEPKSVVVSNLTFGEKSILIQCVEDKKLPFGSEGQVSLTDVQISAMGILADGDLEALCNQPMTIISSTPYTLTVSYPESITVGEHGLVAGLSGNKIPLNAAVPVSARIQGVKPTKTLNYVPYTEACLRPIGEGESSLITIDYAKMGRAEQLHVCTQAYLQAVLQLGNRLPDIHEDFAKVLSIANRVNNEYKKHKDVEGTVYVEEVDEDVLKMICRFGPVSLAPLSVILGGIVAQEIVKATGKYTPIHQWLYFDCFELVDGIEYPAPDSPEEVRENFKPMNCRYDDGIQIWGREIQQHIQRTNLFLVGTGALGCEYLKNFALLGLCSSPNSTLTLTDMDRIEVSNLNRQFLFRKHHVGQSKSLTAATVVQTMNPNVHIEALEAKVGIDTEETVFTDEFWEKLDIVVNALDNVPSRLYIDSKCVWHMKPLIESGTLGPKGNVQVIVPKLTQSYGDTRDPPDESIPLCTLRLFPNLIDHTMEWARDLFQGLFTGSVQEAMSVINTRGVILETMTSQGGPQVVETLQKIYNLLSLKDTTNSAAYKKECYDKCIRLAVIMFQKYFHDDIKQLLYNFPVDHVNEHGTPFWVGNKRPPQAISLDLNDPLHLSFIVACANLLAFTVGLTDGQSTASDLDQSADYVANAAAQVEIPEFQATKAFIKVTDEEEDRDRADSAEMDEQIVSRQDQLKEKITAIVKQLQDSKALVPVEFEKDDDSNFHIQFISAAGNLRARNYKIPEIEQWKAKLIAGKIIPAIATTTAMVTGFATIELLKVLTRGHLKRKIESYKDLFANLSLPLWLLSEPMPPKAMKSVEYDPIVGGPVRCKPESFTPWDKVVIDLVTPNGKGTMKELIDRIEEMFSTEVTILSAGNVCLFMSYARNNKLDEPMRDVVAAAAKNNENADLKVGTGYCIVQACCTDEDGIDVNIPVIKCIY